MPYNNDGAWITQDGVGMPLSSGGIQSLTPSQIATPQQLQTFLQSNPGANANDLASLGYQPIDGSSPGATLPILQKWNPGGQVVNVGGKQYYKVNPAGGWNDVGLGQSFGSFIKPFALALAAGAGGAAFGLGDLAGGAGFGAGGGAGGAALEGAAPFFDIAGGLAEDAGLAGGNAANLAEIAGAGGGGGGAPFMDSFISGTAEDAGLTSGNAANYAAASGSVPGAAGELGSGFGINSSAAQTAAKSALGRLLQGNATPEDYASLLGTVGATGLSFLKDTQQTSALKDLADKYASYGAPSRARYESSFAPGFTMANEPGYQDALNTTSSSLLNKLSATSGNPYGSPGGMIEANKQIDSSLALPALQNYRNQNAATGGYSAFNTAAPGAANTAIGSQGNALTDLAGGLSSILNPKPPTISLTDFLRRGNYSGSLA